MTSKIYYSEPNERWRIVCNYNDLEPTLQPCQKQRDFLRLQIRNHWVVMQFELPKIFYILPGSDSEKTMNLTVEQCETLA